MTVANIPPTDSMKGEAELGLGVGVRGSAIAGVRVEGWTVSSKIWLADSHQG